MSYPEDAAGYSGSLEEWAQNWPKLLEIEIVVPISSSLGEFNALVLPVLNLTASVDVLPGYTTPTEEFELPI